MKAHPFDFLILTQLVLNYFHTNRKHTNYKKELLSLHGLRLLIF
jgi:hypothetical protein